MKHIIVSTDENKEYLEQILRRYYKNFHQFLLRWKVSYLSVKSLPQNADITTLGEALKDTPITRISINSNQIDGEKAAAFGRSLKATNVNFVNISSNPLADAGVVAFIESLQGSKVTSIKVASTQITDAGAYTIGLALNNSAITGVELNGNNLTVATNFGAALKDTNVNYISLKNNRLNAIEAKNFILSLKGSGVTKVDLSINNFPNTSENDITIFGNSFKDTNIKTLIFESNLDNRSLNTFIHSLKDSNITSLNIGSSLFDSIPNDFGLALNETNVTSLNLNFNNINDINLKKLAKELTHTKITSIELADIDMSDDALQAYCEKFKKMKFTHINLSGNKISDTGAKNLGIALQKTNLSSVDISNNPINYEGLKWFLKKIKHASVTSLNFGLSKPDRRLNYLLNKLKNTHVMKFERSAFFNNPSGLQNILANNKKRFLITPFLIAALPTLPQHERAKHFNIKFLSSENELRYAGGIFMHLDPEIRQLILNYLPLMITAKGQSQANKYSLLADRLLPNGLETNSKLSTLFQITKNFLKNKTSPSIIGFIAIATIFSSMSMITSIAFSISLLTVIGAYKVKKIQSYQLEKSDKLFCKDKAKWFTTHGEAYDLGYKSRDWYPYLTSFFKPKAYTQYSAFKIGLEDSTKNQSISRFKKR